MSASTADDERRRKRRKKKAMDVMVVAILDWSMYGMREERVQLIFVFDLICNEVMRKEIVLQFIEPRHLSYMI